MGWLGCNELTLPVWARIYFVQTRSITVRPVDALAPCLALPGHEQLMINLYELRLTHWGQDKMANISQTISKFKCIKLEWRSVSAKYVSLPMDYIASSDKSDKWLTFHYRISHTLKYIWISINITLKFVPKGQINNIPALVQIMAWRRPGDKPLSEAMMVRLLTHIYVSFSLN